MRGSKDEWLLLGPAKHQRVPGNTQGEGAGRAHGAGKQGMRQEKLLYSLHPSKPREGQQEGGFGTGKRGERAGNERAELPISGAMWAEPPFKDSTNS